MNMEQTIEKAYKLQQEKKLEEAEELLEMAIKLWPDHWLPHFDLGCLKTLLRKYEEAESLLNDAEAMGCEMEAALLHNRGWLCRKMGRIDEAIPLYRKAIEIDPDFTNAHNNLGVCLMLKGHCLEGLGELEYRFKTDKKLTRIRERFGDKPDWKGEEFKDKTLLIYNEQGRGDAIQNFRYVGWVQNLVGKVIVECRQELVELFGGCTSATVISNRLLNDNSSLHGDIDLVVSINSLPYIFNGEIPKRLSDEFPYLTHDGLASYHDEWWNGFDDKFRVGFAWAGSPSHPENDIRSIPANLFRKLAIPGVELFSLQYNPKQQEHLYDTGFYTELGEIMGNFQNMANLIDRMDLIVSVDTAVVHLAGAMQKSVWTILPEVPDYRWTMEGLQTPWYDSMLLVRKETTWEDLFDSMAGGLRKIVQSQG